MRKKKMKKLLWEEDRKSGINKQLIPNVIKSSAVWYLVL